MTKASAFLGLASALVANGLAPLLDATSFERIWLGVALFLYGFGISWLTAARTSEAAKPGDWGSPR